MTKAVYDTDNNGIVDNAEALGGLPPSAYVLETEKNFKTGRNFAKYPGNTDLTQPEINDMLYNTWWDTTLYIKQAQYNGGDETLIASYTVIDSIEF